MLTRAVHAEWTKLVTVRSSVLLLVGVACSTVALTMLVTGTAREDGCALSPDGCQIDIVRMALSGVYVGQFPAVVLAVLAVTNEHATGMVHTSLAAVPRRLAVVIAKAGVLTGPVLLAALVGVASSLWVGLALLRANGFTPANGYPAVSLGEGATLRAVVGTVLYLTLIAMFGFGAGLALRSTSGALSAVFGLLFFFPVMASLVGDERWRERLFEWSPMNAGLAVQATRNLDGLAIGPWQGMAVLAAYAAAATLVGAAVFRLRDA